MFTDETLDTERRNQALLRLKKKREFVMHLLVYVTVNAMLIGIWAVTGAGFFWPVFPLMGWAIGVFFHALDVFWSDKFTEEQIRHEMQRL
jgi:hypothetical protein